MSRRFLCLIPLSCSQSVHAPSMIRATNVYVFIYCRLERACSVKMRIIREQATLIVKQLDSYNIEIVLSK
jgi:hypothetical protein